jgi:tellurite resistance protein TehA-like permease
VPGNFISQNFLFDSISALALMIAFYYALSGIACVVYYRHELAKSVKNVLLIGVGPIAGALILGYLFVEATRSFADVEESYSGQTILGFAIWRLTGHERFFGRHAFERVDPEVAAGKVAVEETVGLEP